MVDDERIREQIKDRWTHYNVDAGQIKVEVDAGEVILRGQVDSRRDKNIAEDMALAVAGVREVRNYLEVTSDQEKPKGKGDGREEEYPQEYRRPTAIESNQPGYDPWLDQYSAPESSYGEFTTVQPNADDDVEENDPRDAQDQLADEIFRSLRQIDQLKSEDIRVGINSSGQVILEGRVDNPQSKQMVADLIGAITGVSQVFNHLQVKSKG